MNDLIAAGVPQKQTIEPFEALPLLPTLILGWTSEQFEAPTTSSVKGSVLHSQAPRKEQKP